MRGNGTRFLVEQFSAPVCRFGPVCGSREESAGAASAETTSAGALSFETLEPRLLLSAEHVPDLFSPQELGGPLSPQAVICLDFDGERDVAYNGPVQVAGIDVPAFSAAAVGLGGGEADLAEAITAQVAELLSPLDVRVVCDAPATGEYSVIYIGGTGAAFAAYGSFDGLTEAVDLGNTDPSDVAFVFSDDLASEAASAAELARSVAAVAAHEAGHLLGLGHSEDGPLGLIMAAGQGQAAGALAEVAHESAWDKPVHQGIIHDAAKLYDEQFPGSEAILDEYKFFLIHGTRDQDCFNGFNVAAGFDNPFSGRAEYSVGEITQHHFCAGGDGNELYDGLMHYTSAFTDAYDIFYGLRDWDGPLNWYANGSRAHAYYYLGHVAHLLADMTTPVHVHKDMHPDDEWNDDSWMSDNYEIWVGWNYGPGYQPIQDLFFEPQETVFDRDWYKPTLTLGYLDLDSWGSLGQLFRLTTDYTDDYCSDDEDGDHWQGYPVNFRTEGRHIPTLDPGGFIFANELSATQCLFIARDLMPWAVERTAVLFRFFYAHVDAYAPTVEVTDDPGLSTDPAHPTVINAWEMVPGGQILGTSTDTGSSGVHTSLTITRLDGAAIPGVDPITCIPTADPTRTFDALGQTGVTISWEADMAAVVQVLTRLGEGDYRIRPGVEDGGGKVGQAPADFFVTLSTAPAITDLTLTPGETNENDVTLLEGTFGAADDVHCTVDIDWGDGSPQTTRDVPAGVFSFSAEHEYLDDGPWPGNGTPQDDYTVTVTVTDDDTGEYTDTTTTVTVRNVAPEISDLTVVPPTIGGSDATTLRGTFTDPGMLDAHTVTIAWGDASAPTVLNLPGGQRGFQAQHEYLDDGLSQDDRVITVTVADDDTGTDSGTAAVWEAVIDDGDPGYAEIDAGDVWSRSFSAGHDGDYRQSAEGPGVGDNIASWTFQDVPTGRYMVCGTWKPSSSWSRARNAAFTILDDGDVLGTAEVDMKYAPDDLVAFGTSWECLGSYNSVSGTLTVRLPDDADGKVIADAVYIRKISRAGPPMIGALVVDPNPAAAGATVNVVAQHVIATDATVHSVTFYVGDVPPMLAGPHEPDLSGYTAIGTDTDGSDGWSMPHLTAGLGPGTCAYIAQAVDSQGRLGDVAWDLGTLVDPDPGFILDNGDAGYEETGTAWTTSYSAGYDGDYRQSAEGPGTGENTASWSVGGLPGGMYQVHTTWKPAPSRRVSRATNAKYTLYGNDAPLVTTSVSMKGAPRDFTADGALWERLGVVTLPDDRNSLTVTLTDNADGKIIADAVRIKRIGYLVVEPNPSAVDSVVSLTANYVAPTTATVRFYRDLGGDFMLDTAVDELIGTDDDAADGWRVEYSTLGLAVGTHGYFAEAADGLGQVTVAGFGTGRLVDPVAGFIIDNGGTGYRRTGADWRRSHNVGGHAGDYDQSAEGPGVGENVATWSIGGLDVGTYQVWITWKASTTWSRATNAPLTVFDDAADLGTTRIDMSRRPVGLDAYGSSWQSLGIYDITTGTLTVQLTDDADGKVIADAVYIVQTP